MGDIAADAFGQCKGQNDGLQRHLQEERERRAGRGLSERADEESRPSSRITCIIRSGCNADFAGLADLDNPADHAKLKRGLRRRKGQQKKGFCRLRQYSQAAVSQVNRTK